MLFTADGEFGTETVEADTIREAAVITATAHAGLDCDEICRDPFSFTIDDQEFRAEWSPEDGLEVYHEASGDLC